MEFALLDVREDGKYNGVSFVEISKFFDNEGHIILWNKNT